MRRWSQSAPCGAREGRTLAADATGAMMSEADEEEHPLATTVGPAWRPGQEGTYWHLGGEPRPDHLVAHRGDADCTKPIALRTSQPALRVRAWLLLRGTCPPQIGAHLLGRAKHHEAITAAADSRHRERQPNVAAARSGGRVTIGGIAWRASAAT